MKPGRVAARYWIYGGFLLFALAALGRVSAVDWRTASREPVGLAPDPASTTEAIVQVYAARAVGWRGVFGVHTWFAVKPAGAQAYTVYEMIGWGLRWDEAALARGWRAPCRSSKWTCRQPLSERTIPGRN